MFSQRSRRVAYRPTVDVLEGRQLLSTLGLGKRVHPLVAHVRHVNSPTGFGIHPDSGGGGYVVTNSDDNATGGLVQVANRANQSSGVTITFAAGITNITASTDTAVNLSNGNTINGAGLVTATNTEIVMTNAENETVNGLTMKMAVGGVGVYVPPGASGTVTNSTFRSTTNQQAGAGILDGGSVNANGDLFEVLVNGIDSYGNATVNVTGGTIGWSHWGLQVSGNTTVTGTYLTSDDQAVDATEGAGQSLGLYGVLSDTSGTYSLPAFAVNMTGGGTLYLQRSGKTPTEINCPGVIAALSTVDGTEYLSHTTLIYGMVKNSATTVIND